MVDFVAHELPVDVDALGACAVDWCELVDDVEVCFEVEVLESAVEFLVEEHAVVGCEAGGDGCAADSCGFEVAS